MISVRTTLLAFATVGSLAAGPAGAATTVPLRPFEGVELRGGGSVVLRHGDRQSVRLIRGDTARTRLEVVGRSLRIDACVDRCPPNYGPVVEIVTPEVSAVAITGGGSIEAEGDFPAATSLAAAVQGGGSMDLRAIAANRVAASVTGGGSIRTHARSSLAATVRGGGLIAYWGDPAVASSTSGGGSIQRGAAR